MFTEDVFKKYALLQKRGTPLWHNPRANCVSQLSEENKLIINLLQLHFEYKIPVVIEYGTKYKCTDFIASSTSILSILVSYETFYFRKRVIWNEINSISKVVSSKMNDFNSEILVGMFHISLQIPIRHVWLLRCMVGGNVFVYYVVDHRCFVNL